MPSALAADTEPTDRTDLERRFAYTLRRMMQEPGPMSLADMASRFEDDGYLGSEMRRILAEREERLAQHRTTPSSRSQR